MLLPLIPEEEALAVSFCIMPFAIDCFAGSATVEEFSTPTQGMHTLDAWFVSTAKELFCSAGSPYEFPFILLLCTRERPQGSASPLSNVSAKAGHFTLMTFMR